MKSRRLGGKIALTLGLMAVTYHGQRANAQPKVPAPTPNGFNLYIQAADAFTNPKEPIDEIFDSVFPQLTAAQKAQRYSLARREAWLKSNAKAFALFARAQTTDSRPPNLRDFIDGQLPYGKFRNLARYKVIQSKILAQENKWLPAAQARLDALEMADDISRDGAVIPVLVRFACEAIAMTDFETLVPHLSAPECRLLNDRFEKLAATRPPFSQTVEAERIYYQWALRENWKSGHTDPHDEDDPESAPAVAPEILAESRKHFFTRNDKLAAAFTQQAEKPMKLKQLVSPPLENIDPYNFRFYRVMDRTSNAYTRSKIYYQRQQLRLALHAFQLEKGAYPSTLQQLVPKYLKTLPADPYGAGETWRYKTEKGSYLAWSIGPDGRDDGGKPVPPAPGHKNAVLWTGSVGDVPIRP